MKNTAFCPLLLTVALCGGVLAGGCQQKNEAEKVASVVQAAQQKTTPILAYVRLADLVKASPLQADVQRLRDAQTRLARFATTPTGSAKEQGTVLAGYVLPPLSSGGAGTSASAALALQRQKNARTRLALNANRSLTEFETETRQNTDRRAAQKQSERIAEEEIAGAGALRDIRQTGDRETRNRVAELSEPLAVSRSKNRVFEGQLNPVNPSADTGLPPVLDETAFEAQIKKLESDPKALGISERARMELRQRRAQARIAELEREIRQIVAQGDANVRTDLARLRAERLAKIKQEIARLKADANIESLLQAERNSLNAILAAESAASRRAQKMADSGANSGAGFMAGSVFLGDLGPGKTPSAGGDVVRAQEAVARMQKQRETLQALIVADARESIRDNAQTRNVDVVIIEPGQTPSAKARRDMTNDFKRWFLEIGAEKPQTSNRANSRNCRAKSAPAGKGWA